MRRLRFATSLKTLFSGKGNVLVIAPARSLTATRLPKAIPARLRQSILKMARDTKPGDAGELATTLLGARERLFVGVLPDEVSRHNCPARAEAIRNIISRAPLDNAEKWACLLILDDGDHLLAACNAVSRGMPRFTRKSKPATVSLSLLALGRDGTVLKPDEWIKEIVDAASTAAELVDTPPSELTPAALADRAKDMLKGIRGIKIREIVGDDLLKHDLGGIHAVGRAALSAPRILIADYSPPKADLHVALVGKGICYDTGGLHIKGRGFMEGMKSDMGGAAAVLGAFRVLVSTGCPHRLSLVMCMAENAVGPASYKPDDILTLHSGKTVEINNTDAEGRLLLADGVSWAARELQADVVFDAATLTGAQLIATGQVHAAVVSNDESLEEVMIAAGRDSGDLVHPLPFAPELYKKEFLSPVADMRNSVANRLNAQSSCAAQFVYWHMEDAPNAKNRWWCHVDLAGPAFPRDRATGFGVALLATAVQRLE